MDRSLERFELSPEDYFADVDRGFAALRGALMAAERRIDALAKLVDEMEIRRTVMEAEKPMPQRWTWDVRLPNDVFDDLFEPEPVEGGFKRWVGGSGRIEVSLPLPRTLQYDLSIQIEDFVSDETARSFYLRINGVQYPWLDHAGKLYRSLILTDDEAETMEIEIGIDAATRPAGKDVTFSFREIDVAARR